MSPPRAAPHTAVAGPARGLRLIAVGAPPQARGKRRPGEIPAPVATGSRETASSGAIPPGLGKRWSRIASGGRTIPGGGRVSHSSHRLTLEPGVFWRALARGEPRGPALSSSSKNPRRPYPPRSGPDGRAGQIPIGPVIQVPGSKPNAVSTVTGLHTEFLTVLRRDGADQRTPTPPRLAFSGSRRSLRLRERNCLWSPRSIRCSNSNTPQRRDPPRPYRGRSVKSPDGAWRARLSALAGRTYLRQRAARNPTEVWEPGYRNATRATRDAAGVAGIRTC